MWFKSKKTEPGTNGAQAPTPNGEKTQGQPLAGKELANAMDLAIKVMRQQSQDYRSWKSEDFSSLLTPPLQANQFVISQGGQDPNGLVLWASVSDEVDARLRNTLNEPINLLPDEWHSGQNRWIALAVGEGEVVRRLKKQLLRGPFGATGFTERRRNRGGINVIVLMKSGTS